MWYLNLTHYVFDELSSVRFDGSYRSEYVDLSFSFQLIPGDTDGTVDATSTHTIPKHRYTNISATHVVITNTTQNN